MSSTCGDTPGEEALSVDAQGEVVGTLHTTAPTQGDTVVTNIDLGLQEAVQTALQNDITADKHTVDPTTEKLPTANDGAAVVLERPDRSRAGHGVLSHLRPERVVGRDLPSQLQRTLGRLQHRRRPRPVAL